MAGHDAWRIPTAHITVRITANGWALTVTERGNPIRTCTYPFPTRDRAVEAAQWLATCKLVDVVVPNQRWTTLVDLIHDVGQLPAQAGGLGWSLRRRLRAQLDRRQVQRDYRTAGQLFSDHVPSRWRDFPPDEGPRSQAYYSNRR